MTSYLPRIVDNDLTERLSSAGAVVVEGPKATGKTATAQQVATSTARVDTDPEVQRAIEIDPSLILDGPVPRLLDEWQVRPELWNHVRRAIDDRQAKGQFILTGSATPRDDHNRHSGAGRFSFLRMRPMTLFESGHTNGEVSLEGLMAGDEARSLDPGLTLVDVADRIVVGGWPAQCGQSVKAGSRAARDYLTQAREIDVPQVAEGHRDPVRLARLLHSLGRNVATEVRNVTLSREAEIAQKTLESYLRTLERLMILESQPAWAPSLRSRVRLNRAPKRHFVDPSLAVAATGTVSSEALMRELEYLGSLFESLVIRDLRVFAQPLDGSVFHYRDRTGLEADAIVELADGRWAAFEVKLSQNSADQAARSLLRLSDKIDPERWGSPACLAIITATGYGYTRADGVHVVPIGALAP